MLPIGASILCARNEPGVVDRVRDARAYAFAASPSTEGDAENIAKHALDAAKVSAFDGSMTYVSQETIEETGGGRDHEIRYTISGG